MVLLQDELGACLVLAAGVAVEEEDRDRFHVQLCQHAAKPRDFRFIVRRLDHAGGDSGRCCIEEKLRAREASMPGGARGGIHDRPGPEEVTEAYTTPGGINPLLIHSLCPEKCLSPWDPMDSRGVGRVRWCCASV